MGKSLGAMETSNRSDARLAGNFAEFADIQVGVFKTRHAHGAIFASSSVVALSNKTVRATGTMFTVLAELSLAFLSIGVGKAFCAWRTFVAFFSAFVARLVKFFDQVPLFGKACVCFSAFVAVGALDTTFQQWVFGTRNAVGTFFTSFVLITRVG